MPSSRYLQDDQYMTLLLLRMGASKSGLSTTASFMSILGQPGESGKVHQEVALLLLPAYSGARPKAHL